MTQSYSVSLEKIITAHNLEIIYLPKPADEILITTNEVNRPGIVMTGYTDYFDADRVQILGWTEFGFLLNMEPEKTSRSKTTPMCMPTQAETEPVLAVVVAAAVR